MFDLPLVGIDAALEDKRQRLRAGRVGAQFKFKSRPYAAYGVQPDVVRVCIEAAVDPHDDAGIDNCRRGKRAVGLFGCEHERIRAIFVIVVKSGAGHIYTTFRPTASKKIMPSRWVIRKTVSTTSWPVAVIVKFPYSSGGQPLIVRTKFFG